MFDTNVIAAGARICCDAGQIANGDWAKYHVKLKLVDIDRTEISNVGLGAAMGGPYSFEDRVLVTPKFNNVMKVLEENKIAKSIEVPLVTVRSGASSSQTVELSNGSRKLTVRSKIDERDIAKTVVELAFNENNKFSSRKVQFEFESGLGESVLVRPKMSYLPGHSYLLVASVYYEDKVGRE